jgi:Nitrile hydratase, alpha chain
MPWAITLAWVAQIAPETRVWDSSAEVRYLVLPQRPPATEGMTEAELAALIVLGAPGRGDQGAAAGMTLAAAGSCPGSDGAAA